MSGCSASLVEKLSSGVNQWPNDQEPTLRESGGIGSDALGVGKRAIVSNPFSFPVNVKIVCRSIYQGDLDIHIAAKHERYILLTANHKDAYTDSCYIERYTIGYYPDGETDFLL
jgi:hypothetical protein